MQLTTNTLRGASAVALCTAAMAFAAPAAAQDDLPPLPELPPVGAVNAQSQASIPVPRMMDRDFSRQGVTTTTTTTTVDNLPPEYRSLPVGGETSRTTTGADGVETITRTRRIASTAPAGHGYTQEVEVEMARPAPHCAPQACGHPVYHAPIAAQPMIFEREQWIAECNRRTNGRSEKQKGGIIGALLGAIGGGILGNRIADGERLAGTLIGAGTGGLAGMLLGSIIGGGKKGDRYDCAAALDGYLATYAKHGAHYATRSIPAYTQAPAYTYAQPAHGYAYAPQPHYYQQQQQMVLVPVYYQQQQRVVVRETVREELVPVPGKVREIPRPAPLPAPAPLPSPKMIKQAPAPIYTAPSPKMIKN